MSNFTYESEERNSSLELYEWDSVWWEQTLNDTVPRVLYIGDSISCGVRRIATECSDNTLLFDGFGTSKAVDNPYLSISLRIFAKQQNNRKIVLFNNGLHGWHLDDTKEYKEYYEKQIQFLLEEFSGTPIALVLTTCIGSERNERVLARNNCVRELADKYQLPIIDLYAASVEYMHLRCDDGVHFKEEGYLKLAQKLLTRINQILEK